MIVGAAGATVSTVKLFSFEADEVLLAASVAVLWTVWGPSASVVGCVSAHSPAVSAVVVPMDTLSTKTLSVEPASAVPEYVGVGSPVLAPSAGALTAGAAGAVVSASTERYSRTRPSALTVTRSSWPSPFVSTAIPVRTALGKENVVDGGKYEPGTPLKIVAAFAKYAASSTPSASKSPLVGVETMGKTSRAIPPPAPRYCVSKSKLTW